MDIAPYLELFRLGMPVGSLYTYFPCLFGTLFFCTLTTTSADFRNFDYLMRTNSILLIGAFLCHGFGCTWNDIIDRDIDSKVERTKNRPLPRHAVTVKQAMSFALIILLLGTTIVIACFPLVTIVYSIPPFLLGLIYPYAKRFMQHPQLLLGMTFSCGVFLGKPLFHEKEQLSWNETYALILLFFASVAWTIFYDTIYALQDVRDDIKVHVNSSAVTHSEHIKYFLGAVAVLQNSLLVGTGLILHLPTHYYWTTCLGTLCLQMLIARILVIEDPQKCFWWFTHGSYMMAGTISSGLYMSAFHNTLPHK